MNPATFTKLLSQRKCHVCGEQLKENVGLNFQVRWSCNRGINEHEDFWVNPDSVVGWFDYADTDTTQIKIYYFQCSEESYLVRGFTPGTGFEFSISPQDFVQRLYELVQKKSIVINTFQ